MRITKHRIVSVLALSFTLLSYPGTTTMAQGTFSSGYFEEDRNMELPAYYDCRNEGIAPVVKSQGSSGTCWALTATSALEAAWMPDQQIVYSADHMSLSNSFHIDQEDGGDYKMIMAYLSSWQGPVLESEDPYGDGKTVQGLLAGAHVQEMVVLENWDRESFQRMILGNGPLQTSLVMNRTLTDRTEGYYNKETYAYYNPEKGKVDHDVLILGWDDNFPKENFSSVPEHDGAYICQNTWGTGFGDQGIFYVSYDDANIAGTGLAYTRVDAPKVYDTVYSLDECGWQGRVGYDRSYCYFANIYTAGSAERLKAVGFYSTGTDTKVEIYVVKDFEDASSFERMEFAVSTAIKAKGYFTVDLPEDIELSPGERYAVVVNIDTKDSKRPVAVEMAKDAYTEGVTLEGKESYISLYAGVWEQTQTTYQTNVCLKAYTRKRED